MNYDGKYFHLFFRQSTGEYPIGLGLRLFKWNNSVSLDILFLLWDLQVGFHK